MAEDPKSRLPPSHSVPKGRLKPANRKALLILGVLVLLALLAGVFLSGGRQDAARDALEGRVAPTENR